MKMEVCGYMNRNLLARIVIVGLWCQIVRMRELMIIGFRKSNGLMKSHENLL